MRYCVLLSYPATMRKLAVYTESKTEPNSTRLKRVFAWIPTYVNGFTVWLEHYEVLQAYIVLPYKLKVNGEDKAFLVGAWTDIDKHTL